ncbi:MAG: type II secretion system protein [Capsulimonadaceae bacterium]|nr:type II secretion system protein [Capsulimonadaceae bacterium]
MASKPCTEKAFSLGELLVAIMIVAVLAAALFPLFAQIRERDNQATCQSNLSKISAAFAQYTQDYDQTSVLVLSGDKCTNSFGAAKLTPGMELAPYLKSTSVWRCPDDTVASDDDPNTEIPGSYNGYNIISYGYNAYLMLQWKCGDPWGMTDANHGDHPCHNTLGKTSLCGMVTPIKMSQLKTPSKDGIFFADRDQWGGFLLSGAPESLKKIEGNPLNPWPNGVLGHSNGGSVAYADGHVKWVSGKDLEDQRQIEIGVAGNYAGSGGYDPSFRPFGEHATIYHE